MWVGGDIYTYWGGHIIIASLPFELDVRGVEYWVLYYMAHVMTVVYLAIDLMGSEISMHGGCGEGGYRV